MKKTPISILRREILVCTDPAKEAALRAKLEALLAENARIRQRTAIFWFAVIAVVIVAVATSHPSAPSIDAPATSARIDTRPNNPEAPPLPASTPSPTPDEETSKLVDA